MIAYLVFACQTYLPARCAGVCGWLVSIGADATICFRVVAAKTEQSTTFGCNEVEEVEWQQSRRTAARTHNQPHTGCEGITYIYTHAHTPVEGRQPNRVSVVWQLCKDYTV